MLENVGRAAGVSTLLYHKYLGMEKYIFYRSHINDKCSIQRHHQSGEERKAGQQ